MLTFQPNTCLPEPYSALPLICHLLCLSLSGMQIFSTCNLT